MHVVDGFENLANQVGSVLFRVRALLHDPVEQLAAGYQLHRQVHLGLVLERLDQLHDVRMLQSVEEREGLLRAYFLHGHLLAQHSDLVVQRVLLAPQRLLVDALHRHHVARRVPRLGQEHLGEGAPASESSRVKSAAASFIQPHGDTLTFPAVPAAHTCPPMPHRRRG